MEIILLSGIGTFVLLSAQVLDYLRGIPGESADSRLTPSTAEKPQVPTNPSIDVETHYDRAA
jgi:hypothetical protein